jgi:magnesium transporter
VGAQSSRDPPNLQSVERYCVKAVPTARLSESAGDARKRLTGHQYDDASHVFLVTDQDQLIGVVAMGDLVGAAATVPLADIAKNAHIVTLATDREVAASKAIRASVSVLGVCDADGRFIGALPASALISILRDEHLEDIHHMAGILGKSESAKAALMAPPHRRAFYRLPWLLVASSVATTIGFLLPWLFARRGYDPALGSGPVGTVVQDVLSLLTYFLIASVLVF